MKYCSFCGAKMENNAVKCPACKEEMTAQTCQTSGRVARTACALAYFGTLFWMPLVFCPRDKNARTCANQGLWSLLTALFAFFLLKMIKALCAFLIAGPFSFLANPLTVLSTMLFLFLMLYLAAMCWKNAMAVRKGIAPAPMLFFHSLAMIR